MDILLVTKYYPPEIGAASHLFQEMAEGLIDRGHDVTVVTGYPTYNVDQDQLDDRYSNGVFMEEERNGVPISRLRTPTFPDSWGKISKLDHFTDPFLLFFPALAQKADLVLVYSPPLPFGLTASSLGFLKGSRTVVNIQDLFPREAVDLGLMNNSVLIKFFQLMESLVYRSVDYITVHSEGNKDHVMERGGDPNRVSVVYNWVDTNLITPGSKHNDFRDKLNLHDEFVVSFAGTMGHCQDMNVILRAAKELNDRDDIKFVLVGEGSKKDEAVSFAEEKDLDNVNFLPLQPKEDYPDILRASDVSLVTLNPELETPVVPSKLFSIMASGTPVVASMDLSGDAPKIIRESNCGYIVAAGDHEAFAEKLLKLKGDNYLQTKFGENGRRYAEDNLSRNASLERYENLFKDIIEN